MLRSWLSLCRLKIPSPYEGGDIWQLHLALKCVCEGSGFNPRGPQISSSVQHTHKKCLKRETKGTPPQGFVACVYTLIGSVLYIFGWSFLLQQLVWKKCKVQNLDKARMKKRSTGMIARKTKNGSDELVVFGGYGAPCDDTLPGNTIHGDAVNIKHT